MAKKFSGSWRRSRQPRKQRKYRRNAPHHLRGRMVSAHLDKSLRKFGRSAPVRAGDEVRVVRGSFRGASGKVEHVDTKNKKIEINEAKKKKATGEEVTVPIDPSNVVITSLNLDDRRRFKSETAAAPEPKAKPEKKGDSE